MTDTEMQRRKAICDVAGVDDIGELSDGFHTFNQLYYQRMMLFAAIVKQNKEKAWKSLRHEDGEYCFGGGWFIVGIDTPEGSYTYHYENKYWDMFDCADLPRGKHWDGHTEKDVTRLLSLPSAQQEQQHGRVFKGIVVEYPSYYTYPEYKGKPYFSIKYTENGQAFIGYGTYKPEVLSEYLIKYFMPPAQPEIIRCLECKHYDSRPCGIVNWYNTADDFCSRAERRTDE